MALAGKTVRLQDDLWEQVKVHAQANSLSLSESIAQLVEQALAQDGTVAAAAHELAAVPSDAQDSDLVNVLMATVEDLRRRLDLASETERDLRVIVAGQSAALAAAVSTKPDAIEAGADPDKAEEPLAPKKKKKGKKKKATHKK